MDDAPRRHDVVDEDTGEVIVTMLAFTGPRWVRMVCVAELVRSGYTLSRKEAEGWRDALSAALTEFDSLDPPAEAPGADPAEQDEDRGDDTDDGR